MSVRIKPGFRKNRAFTLIELLVVIAIIAILAAILFPVFAQAKEAAKKSVGVSHMKQMNLACIMYSADYDDVFPLAYRHDAAAYIGGFPWSLAVFPYTKNYDLFLCPQGPPNPVDNADWKYIWAYGTMPRAGIKKLPYYVASAAYPINQALGIVGVRYDGVMGWGQAEAGYGAWGGWWTLWNPGPITVPSHSQTTLPTVADQALIFDAGDPFGDIATFGAGIELGTCVAGRETYNPGSRSLAGATPRWSGGPKNCNGWREAGGGGSASIPMSFANKMKTGVANIGFADGHVKSMGLLALYRHEPCEVDPTVDCMVRFPVK